MKKIRVAWICHFSNKEINEKLPLRIRGFYAFFNRLFKGRNVSTEVADFGVWNINALNEMKQYVDNIELHVIVPYPYLSSAIYEYIENGIHYHFFRTKTSLTAKVVNHLHVTDTIYKYTHMGNRVTIKSLVEKIQPAVVHLMGAENPYISISALDIPQDILLIVQLQTLMSDPKFFTNYPIDKNSYYYRKSIEQAVIKRADYIGTTIQDYRNIIREQIKSDVNFLDFKLAIQEKIRVIDVEKEFDFVYFARAISKAGDWAIASFIEASKIKEGITMLVVGGYSLAEKELYDKSLAEHGLLDKVTFTGELSTHDNVLESVAKARIALLPIKFDFLPNTIREANALGLPVVTSISDGTIRLNEKRQCALLSPGGDHHTMSKNMIRLLEDSTLADELVRNSYIRLKEVYDNCQVVAKWVEEYIRLSLK